eukprot:TRINITY_DN1_c9_g1_i1.p1 TRINITY_DN1_c9_g1~~TRINITY_DN1_c9_g1_i1.p1  ORF type:complete len:671 (-),score=265.40 TRINITY_DN1_c9_g1_i1:90-2102(-)
MSLDRAVPLLQSSDVLDNRNGAAIVINAAATPANVPEILNQNIIGLMLPKLKSNNDDLVMKICWAINNLAVHDNGRNALYKAGVLEHLPMVLKSKDGETIKKSCWALTNLARNPQAQKDIARGAIMGTLIGILSTGRNDDEKGVALQPLCNLVLDAENQLSFQKAGGIAPVVRLLDSSVEKTRELAITLVSFITTNHDSIRDELVDNGAVRPIASLVNGEGTLKMQEFAVNALVNLSISDKAERAILVQGAVEPVVGLLSSESPKLQQQAAMLLSNLLTNKDIREAVRYLSWVNPCVNLLKGNDTQMLSQILRVIINISFDAHCRCMMQRASVDKTVDAVSKRVRDQTITQLCGTALKNLGVPCATDVQQEVDQNSGKIRSVNAPKSKAGAVENDLAGLDDLIGNISGKPASSNTYASSSSSSAASSSRQPAPRDDLDDLLGEVSKPSQPQSRPVATSSAQSRPVATSTASRPAQTSYSASSGGDDLDDLLNEVSKPKPAAKPAPKKDLDDIDDLLADIDKGRPAASSSASYNKKPSDDIDDLLNDIAPSKPAARPVSQQPAKPAPKNDLDDIDSLLADIDSTPKRTSNYSAKASVSVANDDIDDLLSGIEGNRGGNSFGGNTFGTTTQASDDIDDLLKDLDGPSSSSGRSNAGSSGLDTIDDLLADLTG